MSTITTTTQKLLVMMSVSIGLAVSLSSSGALSAESEFAGKRIVPLLQEPRHRTVHKDGEIYLLDVQVNAGDISLPHTHTSPILVTFISNGAGSVNGRVSANTDYATTSLTHELANDGPGMLRIIAMTTFEPGEDDVTAGRPQGLMGEPAIENNWFRSYRVVLQPGAETGPITVQNPSVVVQVTDGKVHVSRADGITAELDEMAKWAWRDANSPYRIRNVGAVPVELVVNEARR